MNILRSIVKSIPVIVIILAIVELLWSNTLVGSGKQVSSIDLQILSLQQENARLEQKVASASSLTTLAVKATEAGFVTPKKTQFVMIGNETLPVALNRPQ